MISDKNGRLTDFDEPPIFLYALFIHIEYHIGVAYFSVPHLIADVVGSRRGRRKAALGGKLSRNGIKPFIFIRSVGRKIPDRSGRASPSFTGIIICRYGAVIKAVEINYHFRIAAVTGRNTVNTAAVSEIRGIIKPRNQIPPIKGTEEIPHITRLIRTDVFQGVSPCGRFFLRGSDRVYAVRGIRVFVIGIAVAPGIMAAPAVTEHTV